jgi:hypothetical protein
LVGRRLSAPKSEVDDDLRRRPGGRFVICALGGAQGALLLSTIQPTLGNALQRRVAAFLPVIPA